MRKSNGITLMSLIVYMTVVFIVLAAAIRITTYFRKNIDDATDITFESEFEKFNIYMLTETRKIGNRVDLISEEKIVFSDNNTIGFTDTDNDGTGEIYFNKTKICGNVNQCRFIIDNNEDENIATIAVYITIKQQQKEVVYSMNIAKRQELPQEYQEVEYIESTGTQYINTGVNASSDLSTDIVYMDTSATGTNYVLGAVESGTPSTILYAIGGGSTSIDSTFNGETYTHPITRTQNEKYNIKLNVSYSETSGFRLYSEVQDLTSDNNYSGYTGYCIRDLFAAQDIYVFAFNSSSIHNGMRLYSLRFWKANNLIRDFVPCYRKSDEKPGLYDLVYNQFYPSAVSNDFIAGEEITSTTSNRIEENNYSINTKLPSQYQEVEWISTTEGGAYIDTGVIPDNTFGFKVKLTSQDKSTDRAIVGARASSSTNSRCWVGYLSNKIYYGWNTVYPAAANRPSANSDGYDVIEVNYRNNRKFIVNGATISNSTFATLTSFNNVSFCLMGRNNGGTCSGREQTMKYAIFTRGENIINYFIPCYRTTDSVAGLYDIINNVFYTNSAATGTLSCGPDVN